MELYNGRDMPLSKNQERQIIQKKLLNGARIEELTLREKLVIGGHDQPLKNIGNYLLKPDHCYRVVSKETFEIYKKSGYIFGFDEYLGDIIEPDGRIKATNGGVDWYLGGFSKRYGSIVLECPADKRYFVPAHDNGCDLTFDVQIRHMKSSGKKNPVPFSMITNIFDLAKIKEQEQLKEIKEKLTLQYQSNLELESHSEIKR